MTVLLAPSSLFRAGALASFVRDRRDGLPGTARGFHLRVRVHPWIGFPLHPFAAWRLPAPRDGARCLIVWRDGRGRPLPTSGSRIRLGGRDDVAYGSILGAAGHDPWLWIEVDADDGVRLDLLDPRSIPGVDEPRILATRRALPYRFGHGPILRLRARGRGTIGASIGVRLSHLDLHHPVGRERPTTFGLPLRALDPGSRTVAWYAPGADAIGAAQERLLTGAPDRMSPPDEYVHPAPEPWDRAREVERILEAIGPALVDPFLEAGLRDPSIAPVDAIWTHGDPLRLPQPVRASAPVVASLLTMAADPSIARYLGLATTMPIASSADVAPANVWLVAGRFAIQADRLVLPSLEGGSSGLSLGTFLGASSAPGAFTDALDAEFPDAASLRDGVPDRTTSVKGLWSVVTLLTVAVAAGDAPPDPPDSVSLSKAERGAWSAPSDLRLSAEETWRQSLSLGRTAVRGMLGFARVGPGAAVALHRIDPSPANGFVRRVVPILPDRAGREALRLTDAHIPPDPAGATWRVWQADEFGRWSDAAEFHALVPPRPKPPAPVAEPSFVATPDDGSSGSRSPGTIVLRYEVPRAADGGPGSRPIAHLVVRVDGVERENRRVDEGANVEVRIAADPCGVGKHQTVDVTSLYVDTDGVPSDATTPIATVRCGTHDARAPRPLSTAPVLVWSGRTDTVGGSELSLHWPQREGADRYGVYLGDARRLAAEARIELPDGRERAAWVRPIHDMSTSLREKRAFTYLRDVPDASAVDGRVALTTRIPGGLRSVQFLRIVPISRGGAEPPFESCGLVPIAVPSSERPPPPIVEAQTAADGRVTLRIRALGMRTEVLAASPRRAPEFRLRRTTDVDRDAAYAPIVRDGLLAAGPRGEWVAEVVSAAAAAEPFARTTWTAEVRYPPESPIASGFAPAASDIVPVWPAIGALSDGLWSEPSAPAGSMVVPAAGPSAP